jgi:hypothetical protein
VTLARNQKAQAISVLPVSELVRPGVELRCGDFRILGEQIADNSIDGLDTDPPYDKASIELYSESAKLAMRVLKPGGLYIAYAGKMYLPQVYAALERSGLEFVWQCAITHNTGHNITWPRRMISGYKPILVYRKPGGPPIDWSPILDVCSEGKQEQNLHPWQQALAESDYFIRKLFAPGSTILHHRKSWASPKATSLKNRPGSTGSRWRRISFSPMRRSSRLYRNIQPKAAYALLNVRSPRYAGRLRGESPRAEKSRL